jgi:putative permease
LSTNRLSSSQSPDDIALVISRNWLRKALRWSAAGILMAAVAWAVVKLQSLALLFVLSFVLASLLEPPVREMESRGIPRPTAVLIVFVVILSTVGVLLAVLIPQVVHQLQLALQALEGRSADDIAAQIQRRFLSRVPLLNSPAVLERLRGLVEGMMLRLMSSALWLFSGITYLFIALFVTFFLLKDGHRMKKSLISRVPNRHFELALSLSYRIGQQVSRYIRGQMVEAIIVGLLSILALYLLKIRYYAFIGALAGLANLIPYFGPIVGALPAILMALIDYGSLQPVLGIVIAFATIQLLDNVLISPTVVSKSVGMHPVIVAAVVLIGGTLAGLPGMLLAVPATGCVKVSVEEIRRYLKFRSQLQQTKAPPIGW